MTNEFAWLCRTLASNLLLQNDQRSEHKQNIYIHYTFQTF